MIKTNRSASLEQISERLLFDIKAYNDTVTKIGPDGTYMKIDLDDIVQFLRADYNNSDNLDY